MERKGCLAVRTVPRVRNHALYGPASITHNGILDPVTAWLHAAGVRWV